MKVIDRTPAQQLASKENACLWILHGMLRTARLFVKARVTNDSYNMLTASIHYCINDIKLKQQQRLLKRRK